MNEPDTHVLTADYVVAMDEEGAVYSPGYVEIDEGKIKSVGQADNAPQSFRQMDYGNAAIIPGLINSHNHVAMSLMRGVADDLPLDDWLEKHIWPLEGKFVTADYVYAGSLLSAVEMLKSGTTLTSDMYFFEDKVAEACVDAGIRCIIGEGAIAFPTPSVKNPASIFDVIRKQAQRYRDEELITVHVAAHSTYATSEEQLIKCAELSKELNVPVQIHCAESKKEVGENIRRHGKSQLSYLNDLGLLERPVNLVHVVWPRDGDIQLLKRDNVSVVSCLQSNLKLGSGIPPIARYVDEGIRVVLGTDGAASNNNLDIWEELRLAAFIAKGQSLDPTKVPARQALRMITIEAARAWGAGDELGSLEPGKKADITVLDLDLPHTTPCYNIYSTLVYSAGASNVQDVFVGGRQVVKNGSLTTINEKDVKEKACEWSRKIRQEAKP